MIKWNLQSIPIKDLIVNKRNPRQISKDRAARLNRLIDRYGLIDKPIVNLDMTIIGGHQRIALLKKKKVKEVECWVAERQLEPSEIDDLTIGLNLVTGTWDWDILANDYNIDDLFQYGFTENELLDIAKITLDEGNESEEKEKKQQQQTKRCPSCGHEF